MKAKEKFEIRGKIKQITPKPDKQSRLATGEHGFVLWLTDRDIHLARGLFGGYDLDDLRRLAEIGEMVVKLANATVCQIRTEDYTKEIDLSQPREYSATS